MSTADDDPLVVLSGQGRGPPVFCMHPIGGHVNAYARVPELLGGACPVYALRSRAWLAPDREHATLAAMAADYAAVVDRARPDGPVRLLGWSMGALTAHGVACELERRGRTVEVVAMIDPQLGTPRAMTDDARVAISMAIQIFHPDPPPGPRLRGELRTLEDPDPASGYHWCIARGLLPASAVSLEAFACAIALLPIHRALVAGCELGVTRAPLVVWNARGVDRESHGWSAHTRAACSHRESLGDHFSIMRSPYLDAIAAELRVFDTLVS